MSEISKLRKALADFNVEISHPAKGIMAPLIPGRTIWCQVDSGRIQVSPPLGVGIIAYKLLNK